MCGTYSVRGPHAARVPGFGPRCSKLLEYV